MQAFAQPCDAFVFFVPLVVRSAGHCERTTKNTKGTKMHEGHQINQAASP
jgi:hypothetical protein